MSLGTVRIQLLTMAALLVVLLMAFSSDVSSSSPELDDDRDLDPLGGCPCEIPSEHRDHMERPVTNGSHGPSVVLMFDSDRPVSDPIRMILGYERIYVEKKELESEGMVVRIAEIPERSSDPELFRTIRGVIGDESFIPVEDIDRTTEKVYLSDIPEDHRDDGYLEKVAESLDSTRHGLSVSILELLHLREMVDSYSEYQKVILDGYCPPDRKEEEAEDIEETPIVLYDDEEETEDVPCGDSSDVGPTPYDSVSSVSWYDFYIYGVHGAADGPVL